LPHISAGWIVSGAADPAVSRKDHRRNFCAYGIGDIAAAEATAAAIAISVINPAIAISVINPAIAISVVNSAVETEAAIVAVPVTAKETMGATTAAVESGDAAAMKSAASPKAAVKAAAVKAAAVKTTAVKTTAVKTAAGAVSRVSGSGE
jgi:hypothetical protein